VLGWAALRRIAAAPAVRQSTRLEPTSVDASEAVDVPKAPGNADDVRQWAMEVRWLAPRLHRDSPHICARTFSAAAPPCRCGASRRRRAFTSQASSKPGGASRAKLEREILRHQQPFLGGSGRFVRSGRPAPPRAAQRAVGRAVVGR
jgi:hypothetical protein